MIGVVAGLAILGAAAAGKDGRVYLPVSVLTDKKLFERDFRVLEPRGIVATLKSLYPRDEQVGFTARDLQRLQLAFRLAGHVQHRRELLEELIANPETPPQAAAKAREVLEKTSQEELMIDRLLGALRHDILHAD